MAATSEIDNVPIDNNTYLIDWFEAGCKPVSAWRAGTEHEKFCYRLDDKTAIPYQGHVGIRHLLETLVAEYDWSPVMEGENLIALKSPNAASITLEPGGQLELSGAPLETVHQACAEANRHLEELRGINQKLGIGMLGLGFQPKLTLNDIPHMPKGRYNLMRSYMPKRGKLGLDMMHRTCTMQTNLDYGSEADMVRKFRVSLAVQPITTALYANSPFSEGQPNGYLSYRSHIWTDTDPDRCGLLPFVFEEGFGFERYVAYLLDVPMYFVYRNGHYLDATGCSFRDFMAGRLSILPGEYPLLSDWVDHVSVAFPEVRLKQYLEMRGADAGSWQMICSLPAFWIGLLYDSDTLNAAWDIIRHWSTQEQEELRLQVPNLGLRASLKGRSVRDWALQFLSLAQTGLIKRARLNQFGQDESLYLAPLLAIAESGITPAEEKLEAFRTGWHSDIDRLFSDYAY